MKKREDLRQGISTCLAVERWLDRGEPDALPAAVRAHVDTCARCERSVARARSLERALARRFPPAPPIEPPAGFADRVLARVQAAEARGIRWLTLPDALPWWTRVAAEPGVVLASIVAALVLWRGDRLLAASRAAWPAVAGATAQAGAVGRALGLDACERTLAAALGAGQAPWAVTLAVTLALLPVAALAAWGLWGFGAWLGGGAPLAAHGSTRS